ncbi:MAG: protein kinase [Planctomycetota bacterium]
MSSPSLGNVDRYQLLELLGRGGMGAVYRAWDPGLKREVALKLLEAAGHGAARERFATEVEALLRLDHPNVVCIHTAGEVAGRPYLIMDLVEGEALAERLERGPLACRAAAALVRDLARALARAHALGVLHRDLKPDNVLLRAPAGEPVLIDFGLAKDLASSHAGPTRSGTFLGTPGYWAPEQARGELAAIGPRTDVYGLGALLYACLTTRAPLEGATLAELAVAAESRAPEPPSSFDPGVDRALEAVCLRCLEKAPGRRCPSAEAVAQELERYLEGKLRPPRPRVPLWLGAGALAIAAGLLAARGAPSSLGAGSSPTSLAALVPEPSRAPTRGPAGGRSSPLPEDPREPFARPMSDADVRAALAELSEAPALRLLARVSRGLRFPALHGRLTPRALESRGGPPRAALLYLSARRGERRGLEELAGALLRADAPFVLRDPRLCERVLFRLLARGGQSALAMLGLVFESLREGELVRAAYSAASQLGSPRSRVRLQGLGLDELPLELAWAALRARAEESEQARPVPSSERGPPAAVSDESCRFLIQRALADLAPRSLELLWLEERALRLLEPGTSAQDLRSQAEAELGRGRREAARARWLAGSLQGDTGCLARLALHLEPGPASLALLHLAVELGQRSALRALMSRDPAAAEGYARALDGKDVSSWRDFWRAHELTLAAAGLDLRPPPEPAEPGWASLEVAMTRPLKLDAARALIGRELQRSRTLQGIARDAARAETKAAGSALYLATTWAKQDQGPVARALAWTALELAPARAGFAALAKKLEDFHPALARLLARLAQERPAAAEAADWEALHDEGERCLRDVGLPHLAGPGEDP